MRLIVDGVDMFEIENVSAKVDLNQYKLEEEKRMQLEEKLRESCEKYKLKELSKKLNRVNWNTLGVLKNELLSRD